MDSNMVINNVDRNAFKVSPDSIQELNRRLDIFVNNTCNVLNQLVLANNITVNRISTLEDFNGYSGKIYAVDINDKTIEVVVTKGKLLNAKVLPDVI